MARTAHIRRETGETRIDLSLDLDGSGRADIATGVGFFDHMLTLLAKHSLIDLTVQADGDLHVDAHHTVEDVGICFGQALAQALGDKAGIRRYGCMTLPMDETLVTVAVDLSGRPFCVWSAEVPLEMLGTFNAPLAEEFWRAVSSAGAFNLHVLLPLRPQHASHHRRYLQGHGAGLAPGGGTRPAHVRNPFDQRCSLAGAAMSQQFRQHFRSLREALGERDDARRLHAMMFHFFLRREGRNDDSGIPLPRFSANMLRQVTDVFDRFAWSLDEADASGALTPRALADTFEESVNRRLTGTYYTGRDVSDYISTATIIPALFDAVATRCPDFVRKKSIDDLITRNIDLVALAAERIAQCRESHSLRTVWDALLELTILDPTCGCGEFLVAALRVLEPLYQVCLARMRTFPGRGFSTILRQVEHCPTERYFIRSTILTRNLYGLDLMPEAVEITRMRLLLMLAAVAGPTRQTPALPLDDHLRAGDVLTVRQAFRKVERGFSAAVGNPPYVESKTNLGLQTASCGNLYAFVVERSLSLLAADGRLGMIVPHSAFCTDRMAPLASLLTQRGRLWVSSYDIRPCKLFAGVDQRLAIFLSASSPQRRTFSTRYHRWHEPERPFLFQRLRYLDVGSMRYENSIPKAGEPIEQHIWEKLHAHPPLLDDLRGQPTVYYHNAPRYWVRALTFAPYFWNERDGEKLSAQIKTLSVRDTVDASVVVALLNSSLFCWWWLLLSDCRHLNRREIDRFPVGLAAMSLDCKRRLGILCRRLMADYRRHTVRKVCCYRTTGQVIYDEYYPGRSKGILDDIDRVLAGHYGLTDGERDFVINYDRKYRLLDSALAAALIRIHILFRRIAEAGGVERRDVTRHHAFILGRDRPL